MMNFPPNDVLSDKCGDKFALSALAAKRAKELSQGQKPLITPKEGEKVIPIALEEIYENKVFPDYDD